MIITMEFVGAAAGLLLICSVITGLIVEALKKMITIRKPNIAAAIVSLIVGAFVAVTYLVYNGIPINAVAVWFIIALVMFSWLCAMLGYDKVVQTLTQIKSISDAERSKNTENEQNQSENEQKAPPGWKITDNMKF